MGAGRELTREQLREFDRIRVQLGLELTTHEMVTLISIADATEGVATLGKWYIPELDARHLLRVYREGA